jgi:hypothetical protein
MSNQPRITITKLKIAKFASEETLCFQATVLFDGIVFAEASNDGHGGSTFVRALPGKSQRMADAEAFAASIATEETFDGHLTDIVDDLVCAEEERKTIERAFKRDMKSKVLFLFEGKIREVRVRDASSEQIRDYIRRKYDRAQILNEMTPDAAFQVYAQVLGGAA